MNNNSKKTNNHHGIYKSYEGLPKTKVRYISSYKFNIPTMQDVLDLFINCNIFVKISL